MTAYGLKVRLRQLNHEILIKLDGLVNMFYHDLNYRISNQDVINTLNDFWVFSCCLNT